MSSRHVRYNICIQQTSSTTVTDVPAELIDEVLRASRVMVSVAARSMAGIADDVTLPQYRALVVLTTRGPQRPTELAAALGSHPSTITRLCDRLVTHGLVVREPSASNRREVTIAVTGKGRRLVGRVTRVRRTEIALILARIPAHERSAIVRALRAFGDAAGEPAEVIGLV
jgi:DNA-binding MarR family transcriptional regulator